MTAASNGGSLPSRAPTEGERRDHAGFDVGRAAHDFEFSFFAGIDVDQIQPVGVGMLLDIEHARGEYARESGLEFFDILDHQSRVA